MSAARSLKLIGNRSVLIAAVCLLLAPARASAQERAARFLAGGALGLALHEAGHVVLDLSFDAPPGLRAVSFGPLPFFAITHETVSPAREFAISSAGFWVQHLSSEILLTRDSRLRTRHAPMLKGILAFNILASAGYASAAFARAGPAERDTRGMAASARIDERWVGGLLLAPAALDALRYFAPDVTWLRWASRASKIGGVLLIVKARR